MSTLKFKTLDRNHIESTPSEAIAMLCLKSDKSDLSCPPQFTSYFQFTENDSKSFPSSVRSVRHPHIACSRGYPSLFGEKFASSLSVSWVLRRRRR